MKQVRCAIYTRKSSEDGLEQGFNSLHAQREACAAYVLSQASEGWTLLPGEYDDGGLSGGTLERPALQRLLADGIVFAHDTTKVGGRCRARARLFSLADEKSAKQEHAGKSGSGAMRQAASLCKSLAGHTNFTAAVKQVVKAPTINGYWRFSPTGRRHGPAHPPQLIHKRALHRGSTMRVVGCC